ncbi:MAG: EF-hand domain-containing protein, partial [Planctomycetaceae bacterium]|nr:EF-hand domain-containing protein [Planctomycetaceae bacterium]
MKSSASNSSHDMNRILVCLALVLTVIALSRILTGVWAEEPEKSIKVPVISSPALSSDSGTRMAPMPSTGAAASPTLPDAKLPQYRLVSDSAGEESLEQANLRFLLALPVEPMLVEAHVTLDKAPFRNKREQHLRALLKAALASEKKSPPNAVEPATDAPGREEGMSDPLAYLPTTSNVEKLKRYIAAIGREPSLKEVRWFYNNRLNGPPLLLLKEGFQSFRSGEMPIFHILDRNRDDVISSEEIMQSQQSFLDCDLNRDGIVHSLEISETAKDPRRRTDHIFNTSPLLFLLPDERNADEIYAELLARYNTEGKPQKTLPVRFDANSNGQWEPEELKGLRTRPADLALNVEFDSAKSGNSSLSLSEDATKQLGKQNWKPAIVNSTVVLRGPNCEVWLSAIQLQPGDQISLGAITDGYPMLPVLDTNDDGRFTIRELRPMTEAIREFDVNGDGQILKNELRPTVRVCFGLGPSVHQFLAGVRSVHQPGSPPVAGP